MTCDGHVVTWGGRHGFGRGGNSLAVQRQLVDVQRLSATDGAFAALLGDGRVPWKPMICCVFFCFLKPSIQGKMGGTKTVCFRRSGVYCKELFFAFFVGEESKKDFRRVPRQGEGDPQRSRSRIPKSHDSLLGFFLSRMLARGKLEGLGWGG